MSEKIADIYQGKEEKTLPLVSVIMPCYNHGDYVSNAIESILNQTYPNIELIVADNGCTDHSFEVINRYRDRIKILRLETNDRRLCGEMLWEAITGEYIAQATADDEWMPEKIELQMEAFSSISNLQVCFTWGVYADENLHVLSDQSMNVFLQANRSRGEWFKSLLRGGNCLCYPSALMRTETYEKLAEINRGYVQLSDYYRWLAAIQIGEIYIVEKPMVKFRWHTSGQNANDSAPSVESMVRTNQEHMEILLYNVETVKEELFIDAFGDEFVHREARKPQELLCEKFFLLVRMAESVPLFSEIVLTFYHAHYLEMAETLQSQYGFTFNDFKELEGRSGIAYAVMLLRQEKEVSQMLMTNLSAYMQVAKRMAKKVYSGGFEPETAKAAFLMLPKSEQENLKSMYEACKVLLNMIEKSTLLQDDLYFELMKLVQKVYKYMDAMKLQANLLGILCDAEEFELFGQLVKLGMENKIDLMEAVMPYIRMTAEKLGAVMD